MHPRELQIKNFTYDLAENKIAKYPLAERDLSKLLIYRVGKITEDVYRNIAEHIPENSLLVFNNTKVIHGRLFFKSATGAKIEIFCLEPAEENTEFASVMSKQKSVRWHCLVGRASKWKEKILEHRTKDFTLTAEIIERTSDAFIIEFSWTPEQLSFAEILDKSGMMPIPPYLKRETEEIDLKRYQTVYAKQEGSVAAPTAGLHFTEAILEKLKAKNISKTEVTLHVGAGTFKPVKSETMNEHEMHAEIIDVTITTILHLLDSLQQNIIAVGTTSLRTIESLYWMGVKTKLNPEILLQDLEIKQWDAYESTLQVSHTCKVSEILEALIFWMKNNEMERLICKTQIMIAPSYQLKIANALITNFHQPNSTLLLLVAAVVGDDWKKIYTHALENDFRFLSYGDGSLLFAK
ncbi:MAG: S-adenosylmethionine:tRNA ribosyltransferase-isomerase [Bacteroidetes bacterium]|nr:S-adenosylmethionine:tRNA ribosyltransferase-isomerase [Bacteroidota bacterium]